MPNQYVNKVVQSNGTTLIDITDTTATAADVAQGKDFYLATGEKATGTASGGGGGREDLCEPLDVDFIDYDGRLVYSYSAEDFLQLSALPASPTNQGLVAQGWNWTLADAKAYVTSYGALVIGQNYITDDGKTRVYISLEDNTNRFKTAVINVGANAKGSTEVTVDWGDGSSSTGNFNNYTYLFFTKTYSSYGNYVIKISSTGDYFLGYSGSNRSFMGDRVEDLRAFIAKKIEVGSHVIGFARQAFQQFLNLESISIPRSVTGWGDTNGNGNMFSFSLVKGLVIPNGAASIPYSLGANRMFRYLSAPKTLVNIGAQEAYGLQKLTLPPQETFPDNSWAYIYRATHIVIPGTYTSIAGNSLRGIYCVRKFTIPATVTAIGGYGISWPIALEELHCLPTTPPALTNTRISGFIPSDCIVFVPYSPDHSILAAYKTATNWSGMADKMQEEPQ